MIMMVPEIQFILRLQPMPSRYLNLRLLRPISSVCPIQSHRNHGSLSRILMESKQRRNILPSIESKRSFWETFPSMNPGAVYVKDGLDQQNYKLVFRSGSFSYVFYSQLVSMSVLAVQAYYTALMIYSFWTAEPLGLPDSFGPFEIEYSPFSFCVLAVFTVQNLLMFKFSRRAIHRIYYNQKNNEYVLIHPAVNPFKTCQIFCKPGELKEIPKSLGGVIMGRYRVRNNRIAINSVRFKNMEHLNRLLGYID